MIGRARVGGQLATAAVASATLEATVVRADGTVEHLGVVSYYHRNPLKRLAWRIGRLLKGFR